MSKYLENKDIFPQYQYTPTPPGIDRTSLHAVMQQNMQNHLNAVIMALMEEGKLPPSIIAGMGLDEKTWAEEYQMMGEGLDESHIDLIFEGIRKRNAEQKSPQSWWPD